MNQKQLFEKIQRIQQQLMQGLIEREQTIKLAFLATLSGEHILLIGAWHRQKYGGSSHPSHV